MGRYRQRKILPYMFVLTLAVLAAKMVAFVCNAKVPTLVSTFLVTMPERNDSLRPY